MATMKEIVDMETDSAKGDYIFNERYDSYMYRKSKERSEEKERETYYYRAKEILEECISLMERKSNDYQGGSVEDKDYYPHGWLSFDTMLTTKILRFRSVMEQEGKVNFDSAEDCLKDLINYSARCIVWLERNKK